MPRSYDMDMVLLGPKIPFAGINRFFEAFKNKNLRGRKGTCGPWSRKPSCTVSILSDQKIPRVVKHHSRDRRHLREPVDTQFWPPENFKFPLKIWIEYYFLRTTPTKILKIHTSCKFLLLSISLPKFISSWTQSKATLTENVPFNSRMTNTTGGTKIIVSRRVAEYSSQLCALSEKKCVSCRICYKHRTGMFAIPLVSSLNIWSVIQSNGNVMTEVQVP